MGGFEVEIETRSPQNRHIDWRTGLADSVTVDPPVVNIRFSKPGLIPETAAGVLIEGVWFSRATFPEASHLEQQWARAL